MNHTQNKYLKFVIKFYMDNVNRISKSLYFTVWKETLIPFSLKGTRLFADRKSYFIKDNNVEQALRVLKRKLQRDGFFKIIKLKNTYEKPSEKKKRILQENIKRVKKLNKLKNRI